MPTRFWFVTITKSGASRSSSNSPHGKSLQRILKLSRYSRSSFFFKLIEGPRSPTAVTVQKCKHLLSSYRREAFEKLIDRIASLKIFDERLHGYTRSAEYGRASHDLRVAADDDWLIFKSYLKRRAPPMIRHPEVRAQRASKGDGPGASAASFEGRFAATSG